jgi:hypothetical protein
MDKSLLVRFEAQHPWEAGEVKAEGWKSSLCRGAPSPVRGGGCRLVVARLGHLKGSAGGKAASLHSGGAGEGSGRDGSSARTGSTLASRARLFDPEPRAPAGSGTNPQTRFTALLERSP